MWFILADRGTRHSGEEQLLAILPPMAAGGLHDAGQGPERRDRSLRRFARRRPRPRQSLRTDASVRPLRRRAELHARQGLQRLARSQGRRFLPEVWISSMVRNFFSMVIRALDLILFLLPSIPCTYTTFVNWW